MDSYNMEILREKSEWKEKVLSMNLIIKEPLFIIVVRIRKQIF